MVDAIYRAISTGQYPLRYCPAETTMYIFKFNHKFHVIYRNKILRVLPKMVIDPRESKK